MRIGIITYWNSKDNYGQLLQCYALQKFLRKMGHEPFLIRYEESAASAGSGFKIAKLWSYAIHFRSYFMYLLQRRNNAKYALQNGNEQRDFDSFRISHIKMSDYVYNKDLLMSKAPEADAYICGSDQIWGGSDVYYLSFAPDSSIKIAYAPSFGGINPFNGNNKHELIRLISRFDFVGMRERSGAKLLQDQGFDEATQVVDPTLLLSREDYSLLLKKTLSNCSDAFVYLLGNQIQCSVKEIFDFLKRKKMSYTYVASQGRVDSYKKSPLKIEEWIDGIKSCKIVITNSFHCVVFSMIFHKPFIYVPLAGAYSRMNDRLNDILSVSGLSSQIMTKSLDDVPLNPDFSQFDQYKHNQCLRSTEIFNSILARSL